MPTLSIRIGSRFSMENCGFIQNWRMFFAILHILDTTSCICMQFPYKSAIYLLYMCSPYGHARCAIGLLLGALSILSAFFTIYIYSHFARPLGVLSAIARSFRPLNARRPAW